MCVMAVSSLCVLCLFSLPCTNPVSKLHDWFKYVVCVWLWFVNVLIYVGTYTTINEYPAPMNMMKSMLLMLDPDDGRDKPNAGDDGRRR